MYLFEKPLIRGVMLKRKSQFTALVSVYGEEMIAHIRADAGTRTRISMVCSWNVTWRRSPDARAKTT